MTKRSNVWSLLILSAIGLILVLGLSSCSSDSTTSSKNDEPSLTDGNVTGLIRSSAGDALEGATITTGNKNTTTNSQGEFLLSGIEAGHDIVVTITKDDYVSTYRTISVTKGRTTHITASLFVAERTIFSGNMPGKVEFSPNFHEGGIELPANAFVDADGNPYNGAVEASARYFDPTDPDQLASFPGTFSGVQTDGTEVPFESYGFISASFRSVGNRSGDLQLADGKKAGLKVPVPSALAANAPETMPLWYFDEEKGKWIEDGLGIKVGDYYEGEVTHFTYWNFDYPIVPEDQSTLTGKVFVEDNNNDQVPAVNAEVIAMGVDFAGYTLARTNSLGEFSIDVKASAQVRLNARMGANSSPSTPVIDTPESGQESNVDDLIIGDRRFKITGLLKNTSEEPLADMNFVLKDNDPPAGSMPFAVWFNTNNEGIFEADATFGTAGTAIQLVFSKSGHGHNDEDESLFSHPISIINPHPGDTYDFGEIILYPGGVVKGRAVSSEGTPFVNTNVDFFPMNAESEEDFQWTTTDEEGYFELVAQPNRTINDVVGNIWSEEQSYRTKTFKLSYPGSGKTNNIGNIRFNLVD